MAAILSPPLSVQQIWLLLVDGFDRIYLNLKTIVLLTQLLLESVLYVIVDAEQTTNYLLN